eukprot:Partr_v1_DN26066_c1_g3_i1_m653 putative RFT1 homolog
MDGVVEYARSLVGLQLISRLATFSLNQLLLHAHPDRLTPSALGVVTMHFELVHSLVLAVSRDAVRSVCARGLADRRVLSLLPVVIGAVISAVVARGVGYDGVMALYLLAGVVELAAEPWFDSMLHRRLFSVRARVESVAVVVKCLVVFVSIHVGVSLRDVSMVFACGQLVYACCLFVGYAVLLSRSPGVVSPVSSLRISRASVQLLMAFYAQLFVKVLLSEGDKIVSALFSDASEQGIYALVSNYGSLVVRLVFLPVEESIRSLLASPSHTRPFFMMYRRIVRVYVYLLMIACLYPPLFAPVVIRLLAGRAWDAAADSLPLYAIYVALLGFNGVSEAYLHSVSSKGRLWWNTVWMVVFFGVSSGVYAVLNSREFGGGVQAIVLANIVNVLMRIVYANALISKFCPGAWTSLFDNGRLVGSCLVSLGCRLFLEWCRTFFDPFHLSWLALGIVIFAVNSLLILLVIDKTLLQPLEYHETSNGEKK